MKRIFSLLLLLVFTAAAAIPAYAIQYNEPGKYDSVRL